MGLGAVEAGGTKFVCAVGLGPDDVRAETRLVTTTPTETIARVVAFFREHAPIAALGVASFGPVDLDEHSPTFGSITTTPKPGWQRVDLMGQLRRALDVPVRMDTDVNAAALAEHRWGAARDVTTLVYVTVGTGIGGGILVNGQPLHGLLHPELGHLRVPHDAADPFAGACPRHADCWEGLASGPALAARWRQPPETLPDAHPAWELEARYLALGLVNVLLTVSPERIVLGGGVMTRTQLYALTRREIVRLLGGYLQSPAVGEEIDRYLVPPALGDRAGVLGALALAQDA